MVQREPTTTKLANLLSMLLFCTTSTLFIIPSAMAQESRYNFENYSNFGVYKQVYPPTDITQDVQSCTPNETVTCPLFVAVMLSFGSAFNSSSSLMGLQIALDQINDDPTMLPGYKLHYLLKDSQCQRTTALQSLHTHLIQPPTKIGVLGSGCSIATEATAEVTPFYNLTQISCLSSSIELANRKKFPRHFQVTISEINLAFGFYGIIKEFGWKRVSLIVQDENLFTLNVNKLKDLLGKEFDIREQRFETIDGIDSLGDKPFDEDSRIYILIMYHPNARELLCKAYLQGLHFPYSLFMFVGWYSTDWWKGSPEEQAALENKYKGCDASAREKVISHAITSSKAETTFHDSYVVSDSGITGSEIEKLYEKYLRDSSLGLIGLNYLYYQQCYDATWALARALNKTQADMKSNSTLVAELAKYDKFSKDDSSFGLQHFTYNNSKFMELVFSHLEETDFNGIVGRIRFDDSGVRIVSRVHVKQYRPIASINGSMLKLKKIGDILRSGTERDTKFIYDGGESQEILFPYGTPTDGIPHDVIVTISPVVSGIFIALAAIGIGLACIGIIVYFVLRKKVVIRLSSPKLNFFVAAGAIILYVDIIIHVLPMTDPIFTSISCNLTPWLTSTGYSLCYGTILLKMARVYFIFDDLSHRKKKPLQDWVLALGVLLLAMVDILILSAYTIAEGTRHNLKVVKVSNKENPKDISGVIGEITVYFILFCHNTSRSITLGVLYGYKMLLQFIALIFAFSIRKVKIRGMNDAKFIAAAVYATSIVTAIVIVTSYTLDQYINMFTGVFCTGFFIGTTAILGLVMIPPLIGHYQDPMGERIFEYQLRSGSEIGRTKSMYCLQSSGTMNTSTTTLPVQKRMKEPNRDISQWQENASTPQMKKGSLSAKEKESSSSKEASIQ